ncbi:MAG: hypothetical protein WAV20_10980, partial [Blastocatellia bacterium]
MVFRFSLNKLSARIAVLIASFAACLVLAVIIISRFVVGTLADDRLKVTREMLEVPVEYFPSSGRLNNRLALAELASGDRDLASAASHARRSVNLSPYDYRFRLTLASIEEARGDRSSAEESLEAARALAPNYWNVRYRLGNLLVREGKLAESLNEFNLAIEANNTLLPGILDLVWRASDGDVTAVDAVSGNGSKAKLTLAHFLLKMARPAEAAAVFASIDLSDRSASSTDSSSFLNALIAAGSVETARDLWRDLAGGDRQANLIWNGGFESEITSNLTQFEWSFDRSEYARLAIDTTVAHTGSRSLRLEFAGRDTTRLDNEVKQLVAVRSGMKYRLECYVRTSGFESPEGPRLVVADRGSSTWIAASEPVAQGSSEWQRLALDFVAPKTESGGSSGIFVTI